MEDKDLRSIQEVRRLVARAYDAAKLFEKLPQARIDEIVDRMAAAALVESSRLGALAVEETGYGNPEDKRLKNEFVAHNVARYIRPLRTMGVISEDPLRRVTEIAVPMGVVAAIIPSTNPTSTAIFKCLISLKAGNGVVLSPHPAAARSILESARVCHDAAVEAGAPEGIIGCMTAPTLEGTTELMKHRRVAVILATGGAGLVKAAYSSGKPAYGVGPGNVPAYIDRSAHVAKAVRDVVTGKTFDHGTLCSSEQSLIVDRPVEAEVLRQLERLRAYVLSEQEKRQLEAVAILPNRTLNTQVVGKSAQWIADKAGITVPSGTRVLVVRLDGVGREHPLSCEKLSPILAFYVADGWRAGCERCKEVLAFGGMGHTLALHANDPDVVRQFGLEKPAFRICVNTPATHGSIGLSTALPPSMTLGCGTYGNNITTDNITPLHLIQVKRVAWETTEVFPSWLPVESEAGRRGAAASRASVPDIVDSYLAARAMGRGAAAPPAAPPPAAATSVERTESAPSVTAPPLPPPRPEARPAPPPKAVDFVCEADVRKAIQAQMKIYVHPRTIITPAARDLADGHSIFAAV
ncbi:MAG: acetaldehyde dehydrogenase [Acidobacteria bacterium]|nr:MAG: acetaldehyde dehydrogenase [Acidobacteriota bacterium]